MWLLDLIGSGLGNLKSENPKPVPPCASFHRFFSRVLGFLITMLHTRVWCSKYFFFIIAYRLRALKTLYLFYLCDFIRKLNHKLKGFLWIILQDFIKKKIFGASDAWFVPLAQQSSWTQIMVKLVSHFFLEKSGLRQKKGMASKNWLIRKPYSSQNFTIRCTSTTLHLYSVNFLMWSCWWLFSAPQVRPYSFIQPKISLNLT